MTWVGVSVPSDIVEWVWRAMRITPGYAWEHGRVTDEAKGTTSASRAQRPDSDAFKRFITEKWGGGERGRATRAAGADFAAERRARLSAQFPGVRIVAPAGDLSPRSNDTDYRFRPHSDFAYLTGLGADHEPGAVLVMEPTAEGSATSGHAASSHTATLYLNPPAGRDGEGFYSDPRLGEFWIGKRPGLADFAAMTGLPTRPLVDLPPGIRLASQPSRAVARALSMMRMVKDAYEVDQVRAAVA